MSRTGMDGSEAASSVTNYARCNIVFSVEVDGDWSNTNVTTSFLPNAGGFDLRVQSRFNGIITSKYSTGFVLENIMLYVAGVAAAAL